MPLAILGVVSPTERRYRPPPATGLARPASGDERVSDEDGRHDWVRHERARPADLRFRFRRSDAPDRPPRMGTAGQVGVCCQADRLWSMALRTDPTTSAIRLRQRARSRRPSPDSCLEVVELSVAVVAVLLRPGFVVEGIQSHDQLGAVPGRHDIDGRQMFIRVVVGNEVD
jgi:hypothetical protein